ncbi:MAG: alpha/beta hydrolase [Halioglobus sp.]
MIKKLMIRVLLWLILPLTLLSIGAAGVSFFLIDTYRKANDNANWYDPVAGIDESYYIEIGGIKQFVQIRGQDRSNPVLVFLHGGPGQPMRILGYDIFKSWTEYFTVVEWDQRGSGASVLDDTTLKTPISMDQMVSDTVDVIEHIKLKLDVEKVILVGHSWGTILGINVVEKRQDLFYAYVSFATGLKFQEQAALLLEEAKRRSDSEAVVALTNIVENWPAKSDRDGFVSNVYAMSWYSGKYSQGLRAVKEPGDDLKVLLPIMLGSPDVSFLAFVSGVKDAVDTYKPLIDYLYDVELGKELGRDMQVPLFFIQGRHELTTPRIKRWVEKLEAPNKTFIEFDRSAHLAFIDEPGKTLITLVNLVRPEATSD